MPKPEIKDGAGFILLTWPDHNLSIKVSRLTAHSSDGRVTGELLISNPESGKPLYPQTSFNCTSERTRSALIKTLLSLDEDRPWVDIINQMSTLIVERVRAGEPIRELWTSEDIPAPEYLLEPILIKGLPTIIFGEKGVTKSTLALVIYACLLLPWKNNPLGWKVPAKSVKAAILDYELPGELAQWTAKRIQIGMDLTPFPLFHRRCRVPLADDLEQIMGWITKLNIEVIIVDSLARACGGDLIKTEPANAFFEALDKLNVTSLILAQTSKDIDSKRKTIYGNALFTYYARNIFELCRSDFLQEDEIDVGLFHRWSNLSKLYPDTGFKISFNGQGTHIESQSVSVDEFRAKVNLQKAIYDALKSGTKSPKQLAEITGGKTDTLGVVLNRLKKKGIVLNPEKGLWALPYKDT